MSNHEREGSLPPGRDEVLARAWREASDEQPSSQLDTAIIAAARKAVADGGGQPNAAPVRLRPRNWLLQWQPLAAAATVAGLAFVLVQLLPREHDFESSEQRTESVPVPAPVESQPRRSAVPAATDSSPLPGADKALARTEQVVMPERAPVPGPVPEPPAVPASPVMTDGPTAAAGDTAAAGEVGVDRREALPPALAGRNASAAAVVSSAREKDLDVAEPLDGAAWSAKVVALHASGDVTAAADALRAFRAADPGADTYLPDSLRDWARSVK
jgi:hypothetical protein